MTLRNLLRLFFFFSSIVRLHHLLQSAHTWPQQDGGWNLPLLCAEQWLFSGMFQFALAMPRNQAKHLQLEPSANRCCLCFLQMPLLRSGWLCLANVTELTELPSFLSYLFSFALFLLFAWNRFNMHLLHCLYGSPACLLMVELGCSYHCREWCDMPELSE